MTEKQIEDKFVTYAESKGCQALKLRIDGQNGWPDRTVLLPNGKIFFAEFKTPVGDLRAMQKFWKKILGSMGFIVIYPREVGSAESMLDDLLGI